MDLPQIDNYQHLFVNDIPLIDVRAPVEFLQGAFPSARNLPLMNNDERHNVGIRYKQDGQSSAIELGHELVNGNIRESRITGWAEFVKQYPHGALYCFRGGLRSKISQQWLYEKTGVMYPRIKGGYKALRRFLIDELEGVARQIQFVILGGRTGSGKTLFLKQIKQQVDLEYIYRHRGSAFGKHVTPQPGQIDIENRLAIAFLKQSSIGTNRLLLEDEASNIGSRRIPACIMESMKTSPLVLLEVGIDERISNIFDEYITVSLAEYQKFLGEDAGFTGWAENLQTSLARIQRRLGGQHYNNLKMVMDDAIRLHMTRNEPQHHKNWIQALLTGYYDPMYDYQLTNKSDRIVFRGEQGELLAYLKQGCSIS